LGYNVSPSKRRFNWGKRGYNTQEIGTSLEFNGYIYIYIYIHPLDNIY